MAWAGLSFSRHLQCFGFSVLKLQCNLKMLDFQPTLAPLLTHQLRSKCKIPLDVIWYHPRLPKKPFLTHLIFSKWTSEIYGSGRTNNPLVCAGAPSSSVALSGPRTSHLAPQTSKAPLRYDVCADTVTDADGRLHGQSSVLLVFRNVAAARPARAPSVAHEWRQEEVGEIRQGALARSSFLSITLFPLVPREHRSGDNG